MHGLVYEVPNIFFVHDLSERLLPAFFEISRFIGGLPTIGLLFTGRCSFYHIAPLVP
jgi:hypothetical protein